jgi:hypothetical protein
MLPDAPHRVAGAQCPVPAHPSSRRSATAPACTAPACLPRPGCLPCDLLRSAAAACHLPPPSLPPSLPPTATQGRITYGPCGRIDSELRICAEIRAFLASPHLPLDRAGPRRRLPPAPACPRRLPRPPPHRIARHRASAPRVRRTLRSGLTGKLRPLPLASPLRAWGRHGDAAAEAPHLRFTPTHVGTAICEGYDASCADGSPPRTWGRPPYLPCHLPRQCASHSACQKRRMRESDLSRPAPARSGLFPPHPLTSGHGFRLASTVVLPPP